MLILLISLYIQASHETTTSTLPIDEVFKGDLSAFLQTGLELFDSHFCNKNSTLCEVFYPSIDIQDHIAQEELFTLGDTILNSINFDNVFERPKEVPYRENVMDAKKSNKLSKVLLHKIPRHLSSFQNNAVGVITRRGYKGGDPNHQVNQDRVIIIKPFLLCDSSVQLDEKKNSNFFIGIWDGHGTLGHLVADFVQQNLPLLISHQIEDSFGTMCEKKSHHGIALFDSSSQVMDEQIHQILIDSYRKVDSLIPYKRSGGCTSSIVLSIGSKLHFANAGDSQTFIASFAKSTKTFSSLNEEPNIIHFITRKDKPHLHDERERIERMGGEVFIPLFSDESSRVNIYTDKGKYNESLVSLAMSRSLGDEEGKLVGVIPDPTVTSFDMEQLKEGASQNDKNNKIIIVVAASDGMLDVIAPAEIVEYIAELYRKGEKLEKICRRLVLKASEKWLKKGLLYRDDISIAIHKVEL